MQAAPGRHRTRGWDQVELNPLTKYGGRSPERSSALSADWLNHTVFSSAESRVYRLSGGGFNFSLLPDLLRAINISALSRSSVNTAK
jgi:hypothetical protein